MPVSKQAVPNLSPRQILVEANGSPFAPCEEVRPVVALIDGRRTNDEVQADDWITALEEVDGHVAIYFELAADHEWWLAFDPDGEEEDVDDDLGLGGPYHTWTTYPTGPWNHTERSRAVLHQIIEELYEGDNCEIYRSKVVRIDNAPEMLLRKIGGDGRV